MFEGGLGPVELVTILAIAVIVFAPKRFSGSVVAPVAEMTAKADVLNTRCH